MGNFQNKDKNNYNFNPLSTEITDYYDLDKFEDVFNNEIHKYYMLNNFSDLHKDLEIFLSSNKNEGFLLYKTFFNTDCCKKIFIKIFFLQRVNNKIRYASLQVYDIFCCNIDYFNYVKKLFAETFYFLNIHIEQINFISVHETNIDLI